MKKSFVNLLLLFSFFQIISIPNLFSKNFGVDSLFSQTEVLLDSGDQAIFGTLDVPLKSEKVPVVLIVPGSGPTDRNGNNPYGLTTDCYKMLASGLAERGVASLRFDKRGVGKSTDALENEKNLTIGVYVNDAEKWVKWLKKDQRFSKVIVLGHSEGAIIGTLVANFQRANGFISLSGAGVSADTLIVDQIFKQSPALADTARQIIKHIKNNEDFFPNSDLQALFRKSVVNYLQSWFQLAPVVEIAVLRCPVLIIQGDRDLQVSLADASRLANARQDSKLVIIEKMNHVLKIAPENNAENLETYRNPALPLAGELVPAIVNFIENIK